MIVNDRAPAVACGGCGGMLDGLPLSQVRPLASGTWVHEDGEGTCWQKLLARNTPKARRRGYAPAPRSPSQPR